MKNRRLLSSLIIATVIVFMLVLTLADRKGPTVINDKTTFSPPKKIEIIVVKEGECLSVIAYRRGVPWKYLAKLNGIENTGFIRAGQFLKVPTEPAE